MRLDHLPGTPHLTYCTNIHAGETWTEISASLDHYTPAIKSLVNPTQPFGLGLRLSAVAAADLLRGNALDRFQDQLARLGAYVFTLNAFPYGPFHGAGVKERVYEPDWRTEERVAFTHQAAQILSALLPERGFGSISTVPGGFKSLARDPAAIAAIQENLLRAAADLVALERETGRTVALALEPEPCCLLETTDETIAFFEHVLLAPAALARFRHLARLGKPDAEARLRLHLGVCYDVCHGAVEFEDPVAALHAYRRAGIVIPKIQLSAAIRVCGMQRELRPLLQRFDTGVYLHQAVVRGRTLARYRDLPDAFAALEAGLADGEWRVHCHVPVFLPDLGEIGSTQAALLATLRALRSEPFAPHLEVETYTWDVLPSQLKTSSKADDIARELQFVLKELTHERQRDPRPTVARHAVQAGAGL